MWEMFSDGFYRLCIIDCVGCGSLVVHKKGLCFACEEEIFSRFLIEPNQVFTLAKSKLKHRYLFKWNPDESDVLSGYVHRLKSPLAKVIWKELARIFIYQNQIVPNDRIYIPIPSSKNRKHSLYFAAALAQKTNGHLLSALKLKKQPNAREQKTKNIAERQGVAFELCEEFTEQIAQAKMVVLVDDVITTGSSYKAAYNVLNNIGVLSENIELWTAFHRGKSNC